MARKYLCVYHDMLPALEGLDYPEVGRLIIAALKYDRDGEQPASLKGKESVLWPVFMSQIDRNRESYKVRCEINRNNALSKANRSESQRIVANRNNRIEEKRIEQNRREEKPKAKADAFAEFAGDNADLLKALQEFKAMRSQIKKPLTTAAQDRLLSKLKKDFSPAEWIPVLNQSVDHCWQDIYPLKKPEQKQAPAKRKQFVTAEEYNSVQKTIDASKLDSLRSLVGTWGTKSQPQGEPKNE